MTDNELLLNISDLLDKKLSPVNDRLTKMEDCIENNILPRISNLEILLNDKVSPDLKRIHLTLENVLSPRLQTIEDCYLSTYKRYQSGVEQIDAMHSDIQIIKSVLREHSKKLQTIS